MKRITHETHDLYIYSESMRFVDRFLMGIAIVFNLITFKLDNGIFFEVKKKERTK